LHPAQACRLSVPSLAPSTTRETTPRGWLECEFDCGSPSDIDESLAQAASSLEISCAASVSRSPGVFSSVCGSHSGMSAGWSPATSGSSRPHSRRRSISELSQSARMTPKTLEKRGMGIPWQRAACLCKIDLDQCDNAEKANAEKARNFCLVPTPELKKGGQSPMHSPSVSSPGSLQRRFNDRVRMASLCHSPTEEGGHHVQPCTDEDPTDPDPASPIQPTSNSDSPIGSQPELFSPPPRRAGRLGNDRACSVSILSDVKSLSSAPKLHTARRAEERMHVTGRVQPQILKARKSLLPSKTPTPHGIGRSAKPAMAAGVAQPAGGAAKENRQPANSHFRAGGKFNHTATAPLVSKRDLRRGFGHN